MHPEETAFDPDAKPTPWVEAGARLAGGDTYWLATTGPDGRPHVVPVLAVWLDGALHFSAGPGTRKARDLAARPDCVVSTGVPGVDLVVEGRATRVTDEATLKRVAEVYAGKYDWRPEVKDQALHSDGAPTAGPPPFHVYVVTPTKAFGFGTDGSVSATRYDFGGILPT